MSNTQRRDKLDKNKNKFIILLFYDTDIDMYASICAPLVERHNLKY